MSNRTLDGSTARENTKRNLASYRKSSLIKKQILEAVNFHVGINRTKIRYKAKLSTKQIKHYLNHLVNEGLIQFDSEKELYKITEKGLRFLRVLDS